MLATFLTLLVLGAEPPAETAAALAHRSMIEYDLGQFDKALEDVTRAYELEPHPELLFNLGQCHRALGHWQQAEFFYRGYLRQRPDTPSRAKVEALIAKMVAKQQEAPAPPVLPPAPVVPPPVLPQAPVVPPPVVLPAPLLPAPTPAETVVAPKAPEAPPAAVTTEARKPAPVSWDQRVPTGAWVVGGIAAGCLIAGGTLGVSAAITQNSDQTTPVPHTSLVQHSIALSSLQAANNRAKLANGFYIAGAVLAVGAITWALVAPRHPPVSSDGAVHF